MCVFGLSLNFIIKRIIFGAQNLKNTIFGPVDHFKQASEQKNPVGCYHKMQVK